MTRQLWQGDDWRLGWSPDAEQFQGLVGADAWSMELTAEEFHDFCRLTLQLADTMTAMATELMDDEKIQCEAESEHMWLEVDGFPHRYTLQLILLTGRRGEGMWSERAVPQVIKTVHLIATQPEVAVL